MAKQNETNTQLKFFPLDSIEGARRNPKGHDIRTLTDSIRRFGFRAPLIENPGTGRLVAGHGRLEALRGMRAAGEEMPKGLRGDWEVPVLTGIPFSSEEEAEAYLLADNRLAELGGWDNFGLAEILQQTAMATEQALEGIGWTPEQLEALINPGSDAPGQKQPPAEFKEHNEQTATTDHVCPRCGYEF